MATDIGLAAVRPLCRSGKESGMTMFREPNEARKISWRHRSAVRGESVVLGMCSWKHLKSFGTCGNPTVFFCFVAFSIEG